MENSGMGFIDAVQDLAQQVGLTVPEDDRSPHERERAAELKQMQATLSDVLAKAAEHYRKQLKASPRAIEYLRGRGLTGEVAATFGLGYAPEGWRGLASVFPQYDDPLLEESGLVIAQGDTEEERKRYDRFRDRVMFPIRSVQGEVIGFGGRVLDKGEPKYLNSPETPVFVKGRELYGLHEARAAIRQRGYVLVVEGYMDVVALAQLGFPNAVATLGTACTAEHVQKLFRFTESVVFSFDGDAAGRRAAGRALEASLPHASDTRTIRFLFLPPEHDPDSYVREHGTEAFEQYVSQAVPLSLQLVEAARDGVDLDTAEGRAKFLANAKPLWSALPDGALKLQLLGELAQMGAVAGPDLARLWQSAAGSRRSAPASEPVSEAAVQPSKGSRRPPRFAGRAAPARKEDTALRMLLLHSEWWQQLDADDHELLAELPAPHGPLCAWLERHLHDQGETPWAVLEQALKNTEWAETVARWMPESVLADEITFADLRRVVDSLRIDALKDAQRALIERAASDPAALARWRELDSRIRQLTASQTSLT
jgi:DNA primase